MPKEIDNTGERYDKLLVLSKVSKRLSKFYGRTSYLCLCDCGNTKIIRGNGLRTGNSKSCGCLAALVNLRHGWYGSKVYSVWEDMVARCSRETHKSYKNYGGRGIKVCTEWKENPQEFIDWALENGWERGLQIDRIDNNGDYEPSNCRFVTPYENIHNRRLFAHRNKTGYVGVYRGQKKFITQIQDKFLTEGKHIHLGTFPTAWAAAKARNNFIRENNLPHRIQKKQEELPCTQENQ